MCGFLIAPHLRRFLRFAIGLCLVAGLLGACSPAAETAVPLAANSAEAVKLLISQEGIYTVSSADLRAVAPLLAAADPARLKLSLGGQAQPLWVSGKPADFNLRFYGSPSASRYARQAAYWLELSDTTAAANAWDRDAAPTSEAGEVCLATIRLEQNLLYAPQAESGDHWFWQSLPAPKSQSYEAPLAVLVEGAANLRVALWGSTSSGALDPDHHVRLLVNEQLLADESWDGQQLRTLQAEIPAGVLRAGDNTIGIELPGDTGAPVDIVFVDWIEIDYPVRASAERGRLACRSLGGNLRLSGFDGEVFVLDVTDPDGWFRLSGLESANGNVSFRSESGHRYLVASAKGMLTPDTMALPQLSPDLRSASADYIAIGPPDLLAPLQPLLDRRVAQGLRGLAVPLQAVYDQFGYAAPEPQAVRDFLAYAWQNWQPAPRFVLLVGDATYDPLGYVAPPEANRLPTFFVQTAFGGETASDVTFALLDGDDLPDIAIGRLPARTPAQVQAFVEKLFAYEQAAAGEWGRRVLAIADGQDADFQGDAQAFLDQLPPGFDASLYAPPAGVGNANLEIKTRFEQGVAFAAYFGHGSVVMWGKDQLFTVQDAASLSNQHLPVVMNMSCLTGLFTHPKLESLAEAMLFKADGGAVALLAPTSLTLPSDQSRLSGPLAMALGRSEAPTLGEWLLQAQRQTPDEPGVREVMLTFLLFGDPALRPVYLSP